MCLRSLFRGHRSAFALFVIGLVFGLVFGRNAMAAAPGQLGANALPSVNRGQIFLHRTAEGTSNKQQRAYQLRRQRLSIYRRPPTKSEQSSNALKRSKISPQCLGGHVVDGVCRCAKDTRLLDGICIDHSRPNSDTPRRPGAPVLANPLPPLLTAPLPATTAPLYLPPNPRPADGALPSSSSPPVLDVSLPFVPDEVLAVIAVATPESVEMDAAARFNLVILERSTLPLLSQRVVRFRIPDGRLVNAVAAALANDATIGTAQPNFIYRPQQISPSQPSLQYAVAKVDLAGARTMAVGRGAIVAVIDTGIDTTHEDLRGSDIQTFDTTGSVSAKPDMHGTAIAGIISARGMLEGVAPAARIIGIRAFAPTQAGSQYSTTMMVLKAMDLAIAQHAKVMNLSFAGPADLLLKKAIVAGADRDVIMVAAAGNNGHLAPPSYPAAYPEVIAVTAVDAEDHLYAEANVGAYVAVAAPGVDVLVPTPGNSRELQSGTSFAAAYVTGIVALMLERNVRLTSNQARTALADGAISLGSHSSDAEYGAGRVNAAASLRLISARSER